MLHLLVCSPSHQKLHWEVFQLAFVSFIGKSNTHRVRGMNQLMKQYPTVNDIQTWEGSDLRGWPTTIWIIATMVHMIGWLGKDETRSWYYSHNFNTSIFAQIHVYMQHDTRNILLQISIKTTCYNIRSTIGAYVPFPLRRSSPGWLVYEERGEEGYLELDNPKWTDTWTHTADNW